MKSIMAFNDVHLITPEFKNTEKARFLYNCASFLHRAYQINPETSRAIAECLLGRMNNMRLHYHTFLHILATFDFAEENNVYLQKHEQLAIWFHDAIYDISLTTNERQSGEFMIALLKNYIPHEEYMDAYDIILDTAKHTSILKHNSSDLVLDLDVSNFAYNREMHLIANAAIQAEYPSLTDAEFAIGRLKFLDEFMDKGFIFRTPLFKDKFEQQARDNIQLDLQECERILNKKGSVRSREEIYLTLKQLSNDIQKGVK